MDFAATLPRVAFAQSLHSVIPGRIEDASPESIKTQECWEKWIPGLRLPRKIAWLFCRDGASRNDTGEAAYFLFKLTV
jgi:hypothetical protein